MWSAGDAFPAEVSCRHELGKLPALTLLQDQNPAWQTTSLLLLRRALAGLPVGIN